jgi:O-antigen/teichoic acid export membrane protein
MVYLVKVGSWLGFSQIISTGSALILSVAFANLLPAETYGTYKYILSLVTLLAIPTLSGMDSTDTRAVARGFEATVHAGQRVKLKWGSISFFTGVALSLYYFTNGNQILSIGFLIASISVPLWESFDIYNAVLNGKNFSTPTHIIMQSKSFPSAYFSLFWSHNLIYILIGYFGSNTLLEYFFFDPEAVTYGKHLSFMDVIGTVLGQQTRYLSFTI